MNICRKCISKLHLTHKDTRVTSTFSYISTKLYFAKRLTKYYKLKNVTLIFHTKQHIHPLRTCCNLSDFVIVITKELDNLAEICGESISHSYLKKVLNKLSKKRTYDHCAPVQPLLIGILLRNLAFILFKKRHLFVKYAIYERGFGEGTSLYHPEKSCTFKRRLDNQNDHSVDIVNCICERPVVLKFVSPQYQFDCRV